MCKINNFGEMCLVLFPLICAINVALSSNNVVGHALIKGSL